MSHLIIRLVLILNHLWILKACDFHLYHPHLTQHTTVENTNFSFISNFDHFDELMLDCNQTYPNITSHVAFLPRRSFLVDTLFDLKKIFSQETIDSLALVYLRDIKGVDLNSMPFKNQSSNYTKLNIFLSKMNVYSNQTLVDSANHCNLSVYRSVKKTFLNSFNTISFVNVVYPPKWCPYLFSNSNVVQLIFRDITNSFINKNNLQFYELSEEMIHGLRNTLINAQFDVKYVTLDRQILNRFLFKNVVEMNFFGVVNSIETMLLKEFPYLKSLDMSINNLKDFLQQNLTWMTYLNFNVRKINLNDPIEVNANMKQSFRLRLQHLNNMVSFDPIYEYPDEDICNFKNFPHDRLVFPIIVPGKILNCTCTLYWLQKYAHLYGANIQLENDYATNYQALTISFLNSTFIFCAQILDCDLEKRFAKCNFTTLKSYSHAANDVDIFYLIKWLQFILLTILQPFLCLIGLTNNVLTLCVIRNRTKRKDFNSQMYKHIQINAVFNIAYCLIMPLKLINTCIFIGSGIFCSTLHQVMSSQYFKIVVIKFVGNVIKICSNFTYLIFSLSRLLLVTVNKERVILKQASNLFFICYIGGLLVFSAALSSFKLFQYSVNIFLDVRRDFPYEIRDEFYCKEANHSFECKLFNGFKIFHRVLNDILFVFLNVLMDFILIRKFKRHLNKKIDQIIDLNHHKLIEKSKKNLNRMILYNSLIYVVSHLPEFFTTILLIVYAKTISNFCKFNFSCDLINEEAEFFGLISIVCQFYIFKIFDRNFSNSFNDLKRKVLCFKVFPLEPQNFSMELKNLRELIGDGRID
jgi:hypothetical protein